MTASVGLSGVVRSEWIKACSLRSTLACYGAIAATLVGVCGAYLTLPKTPDGSGAAAAFTGLLLVELLVGATAVLAASAEYSAHTARSTFAAVPQRPQVLVAKAVVAAGLVAVLLAVASVSAVVAANVVAPAAVGPVTDGLVIRAVAGTAFALCAVVVLGVSAGFLTRSAAGGIGLLFLLLFLPVVVVTAPEVTAFLPGRAVQAVVLTGAPPDAGLLSLWPAVATLAGWSLVGAAVAAAALRRRDV